MIQALLTYILNVYPQGVQISRMVDPFVYCIMTGALSPVWPTADTLAAINEYEQQKEKECYAEKDQWQPIVPPKNLCRLSHYRESNTVELSSKRNARYEERKSLETRLASLMCTLGGHQ